MLWYTVLDPEITELSESQRKMFAELELIEIVPEKGYRILQSNQNIISEEWLMILNKAIPRTVLLLIN
jgi:hypothetical protein